MAHDSERERFRAIQAGVETEHFFHRSREDRRATEFLIQAKVEAEHNAHLAREGERYGAIDLKSRKSASRYASVAVRIAFGAGLAAAVLSVEHCVADKIFSPPDQHQSVR